MLPDQPDCSGLNALIWMEMGCSHQMKSNLFEQQLHRMECMAQEPVLFEDILCQIVDMIGAEVTPVLDSLLMTHLYLLTAYRHTYFCMTSANKWLVDYRMRATSLYVTWEAANYLEMFSTFFSISISFSLLKVVILFLFVR